MQRIGCLEADRTAHAAQEGTSYSTLQLKHFDGIHLAKVTNSFFLCMETSWLCERKWPLAAHELEQVFAFFYTFVLFIQ